MITNFDLHELSSCVSPPRGGLREVPEGIVSCALININAHFLLLCSWGHMFTECLDKGTCHEIKYRLSRASVFLMRLSWTVKGISWRNECQMESDEVMSHSEGCICIMQS